MKILNLVHVGSFALICIIASSAQGQSNLLINGSFELGNTGFSSDYTYSHNHAGMLSEGDYDIVSNPYLTHSLATSFGDHTSGTGLMFVVNGGNNPAQIIWSETVNVATNTTYALSGWSASWSGGGFEATPGTLVFYVNGIQQGNPVEVPQANATWQSFTTLWNSQSATQAVVEIHDLLTSEYGNDFTLDDLSFAELSTNLTTAATIYNSVEINWGSISNKTYQIQWSPSLPASNWFNLGNPVTAVSTNSSVWDRVTSGARFYRVLVFQ